MPFVHFRFYADLNDFLPLDNQGVCFDVILNRRTSVKDMIEALGVPHTEVEVILINSTSVDFSYLLKDADRVSVYPAFDTPDITPLIKLNHLSAGNTRFVLDCHLGRLARYLRQLGFDTLYRNDYDDDELATLSANESRILLTRDRNLLKRSIITYGYFVRETDPRRQIDEIIRRYALKNRINPFGLCTRCNGKVMAVDKKLVMDQLEPNTKLHYNDFYQCADCKQVYWEGSHFEHMKRLTDHYANHF